MKNLYKMCNFIVLSMLLSVIGYAAENVVMNKANGGHFQFGSEEGWELVGKAVGNSQEQSVALVNVDPSGSSIEHFHPAAEEVYYVLAGEGVVSLNQREVVIKSGDAVVIHQGVHHRVRNTSDAEKLQLLVTCVPPWTPEGSIATGK